jgi:hypothetical protein
MWFEGWRRERRIRGVLKRMARQRVCMILPPQGVWVIECAVPDAPGTEEAFRTCHLRGWVEPIENAIPKGELDAEGKPREPKKYFTEVGPLYRLTEAGWNVIRGTHALLVATCTIAFAALVVGLINLFV